jgi:hypothetical protein
MELEMIDLISPEEAAKTIGLPASTLAMDRRRKHLKIPYYRLGRRIKYSVKELENWLARQQCNEEGLS